MKRSTLRISLAVLVVGGPCGSSLSVGSAVAGSAGACAKIADAVLESCRSAAAAALSLARARCENLPAKDEVRACRLPAKTAMIDEKTACVEQRAARLQVCKDVGAGIYRPVIDPTQFVSRVDNPYYPLLPGTRFVFESASEHVEVFVTHDTRQILGVPCTVVRDVVTSRLDGQVVEDTLDFFAQDVAGNVWYFGEESKAFENGDLIGIEGSWKAGRNDAQPGIIMKGTRTVGGVYRQEFAAGEAEDLASIVGLNESVSVPYGSFTNVLHTNEFSPFEPDVSEEKFYASGVGNILVIEAEGGRLELLNVTME